MPLREGNKAGASRIYRAAFFPGKPPISERFVMFKRTIAVAVVSLTLLAVSACNTVSGAGKDVSSAGKAVSNAAEDAK